MDWQRWENAFSCSAKVWELSEFSFQRSVIGHPEPRRNILIFCNSQGLDAQLAQFTKSDKHLASIGHWCASHFASTVLRIFYSGNSKIVYRRWTQLILHFNRYLQFSPHYKIFQNRRKCFYGRICCLMTRLCQNAFFERIAAFRVQHINALN